MNVMSTPYFCTKCGRQHVRGAIYLQHQEFKDSPTCNTTFDTCPTFQAECGKHNTTTCPPIMEVETPTREEILASIDVACTEAAIPEICIPTVVSGDNGGTVERWEPRIDFQRNTPFVDRAIEAVQHETLPAMRHGEVIKKSFWHRLFHR